MSWSGRAAGEGGAGEAQGGRGSASLNHHVLRALLGEHLVILEDDGHRQENTRAFTENE